MKTMTISLHRRARSAAVSLLMISCALVASSTAGPQEPAASPAALVWTDIRTLDVEGKGWTDTKAYYDRLPARAEGVVRGPVWSLSRNSAGLCVRFVSDASDIHARWTVTSQRLALPHMPASGVSGLDLYVRTGASAWRWLGAGRPADTVSNTAQLVKGIPPASREYVLYLPLYNGVASVEIGVPQGNTVVKAPPRPADRRKPILFYGTSITQGGCASRPGMVYTAILGRRLDRPVINLGFSGNGKMEPEMARLVAELDPAVFVLDCVPNMSGEEITERVEPFVRTLRERHADTPILLAEDRTYANAFLVTSQQRQNSERRAALRAAYSRMSAAGIAGLHYLPGEALLGDDGEATVDSSHPTDLGFLRQADGFEKALALILSAP